jgi:GDPmannose 4,6-dehydratase
VQGWLYNHEGTRRGEEFVTRKISKGVVKILNEIKNGKDIVPITLGNLDAKRDWGDAEDFVDAVWRMMNQEKYNPYLPQLLKMENGIPIISTEMARPQFWSRFIKDYVVGTGEDHSIREFVEAAFEHINVGGHWVGTGVDEQFVMAASGSPVPVLVTVDPKFYRPAEVNKLVANYSLIEKDLGWKPTTTFKALVQKMVDNDMKA